jgi:YebC/PmpR family DNA-binding regulatory protein
MSGHNKWSTIKHKKAKTDAQRGKIFSKISREITQAVRMGGSDPEMNSRLRLAIQKAKEANMPNDNLSRAIQKGAGLSDDNDFEEIQFEAYGPNGVGILIDVLTDNRNRSVANIKVILNKSGASMAKKGAVSYQFSLKGLFVFEPGINEAKIMDLAIENGAADVVSKEDGSIEIVCEPRQFEPIKQAFDAESLKYATATVTKLPDALTEVDSETAEKIMKIIEKLEDDDDVQDVYSNFNCLEAM